MMFKNYTRVCALLFGMTAAPTIASAGPVDPFGSPDLVYLDSVTVTAGSQLVVNVNVRNDETLGAISIPLRYDTTLLTLQSVSFVGSRVEYIGTRLVNPALAEAINGHFVVGVIRISEAPIPPGDGSVFKLTFNLSPLAVPGAITTIDSLFYAPGGELLLVESSTSTQIHPLFNPGKVVVREKNRAPLVSAVDDLSVLEGDSLVVLIRAADPDGDRISLAAASKPSGASFVDNGNGTARMAWVPDYVGPNSSEGSPFAVTVWASDGKLSSQKSFGLTVINRNRAPILTAPALTESEAGQAVHVSLQLTEPDFETITWSLTGLPGGAAFDETDRTIDWITRLTDTGEYVITAVVSDPHQFADTAVLTLRVNPVPIYTLSMDTADVFPGEIFNYDISLKNLVTVSGFNLLFTYDISALTLISVTRDGTRASAFEQYTITQDDNGLAGAVRIVGVANLPADPVTPVLAAGEGAVVRLSFRVSSDLDFAGQFLPVRFRFLDSPLNNDNSMSDSLGAKIEASQTVFVSGGVQIKSLGEIIIGDINLNGLGYEIGDAIYFSNYFISPGLYPFNPLQYANSDVNRDGNAATISDLVRLINIMLDGGPNGSNIRSSGVAASTQPVAISTETTEYGLSLGVQSDVPIGALLVKAAVSDPSAVVSIQNQQSHMTLGWEQNGSIIRILLYSLHDQSIAAGTQQLMQITGAHGITIESVELVDPGGNPLDIIRSGAPLPEVFELEQNYPNPFNPETEIAFSLPQSDQVELTIYNVTGQEIIRLADDYRAAGRHVVRWNGTDATGQPVASGIYFYRLSSSGFSESRKMLLVK